MHDAVSLVEVWIAVTGLNRFDISFGVRPLGCMVKRRRRAPKSNRPDEGGVQHLTLGAYIHTDITQQVCVAFSASTLAHFGRIDPGFKQIAPVACHLRVPEIFSHHSS